MLRTLLAVAAAAATAAAASGASSRTLQQVAFSDPRHGYGLIAARHGSGCEDVVERTSDGGAHFTRAVSVAPCSRASSITFSGAEGFLYGPGLYATDDGGARWSRRPQPGAVLEVAIEHGSVWLAERVCKPTCTLALYTSLDGRPAAAQPAGLSAPRAIEPAAGQDWLVRTSASSAYMLGEPTANDVALDHTSDGGRRWTRTAIPCSAFSAVLAAAPGGRLFALCAGEPSAGGAFKWLASSADDGRTWRLRRAPVQGYAGTLAATSASTAFALGPRSPLLITRDGGASWRALAAVGDVNGTPAQVQFVSPHAGIVLGSNIDTGAVTIWHTSDAGASWTALQPSI